MPRNEDVEKREKGENEDIEKGVGGEVRFG